MAAEAEAEAKRKAEKEEAQLAAEVARLGAKEQARGKADEEEKLQVGNYNTNNRFNTLTKHQSSTVC